MKKYRYEEMFPEEFLQAVEESPVFLVPTGLLEWHGNHLPLGLDALKAHGICCRIAEKLQGGIVMPANYVGRPGFSSYAGTLTYSEALVNGYFYELFGQLKKVGARVIYVLTGHYGPLQVDCLKRVAECFSRENPSVQIIAQPEYEGVEIDGAIPADHAGIWETSIFWALFPQLVNAHALQKPVEGQKIYINPPNDYYQEDQKWEFVNDVNASSPELGVRVINAVVEDAVCKIEAALQKIN